MAERTDLPRHAAVVVIGGGIVGCSVAYHLAKRGASEVVLIERDTLTSGTTWHAAGVVGSLRASAFLTRLTVMACHLFPALEMETGQSTGYRRTGGLSIAQTQERLAELKRVPSIGKLTGLESELLTPNEVRDKSPILEISDLAGGVWIPWDGQTNPTDTTMAFSKGARLHGAKIFEHTAMTSLKRRNRTVATVCTTRGDIECDQVVLCCGMWSRHLGRSNNLTVPLQAVEHMYVVTEPMAEVAPDQPFIRDFDASIYIKGDAGKLLIGSVDPVSKPWAVTGIPRNSSFIELPEDWVHFEPYMEAALKRVPSLATAGIRQFMNGPESFTVDARHIMGPAAGYSNLFIAAGFNTTGIMSSAGVGDCVSQWMMDGYPPLDTWEVDPRRFERWASTDRFIEARTFESPGLAFAMHWPYRQPTTARNVKQSVVHDSLRRAGACFGVVAGWEKPMWYAPKGIRAEFDDTMGPQSWWCHAETEARTMAQGVGLYDQSQLAVFLIEGPRALEALQCLCANNVNVAPGQIVYSQLLNPRGGIEADITVTRLSDWTFRLVTGAPNRVRDRDWIEAGIERFGANCTDITESYAIFSLMGPRSRELLANLTTSPLDPETFPYGTYKSIDLGYGHVHAQRLSYVGELGFELFVPTDLAQYVYERLIDVGESCALGHAGLLCMDSCRIEKAYRHWGHELTPSVTPIEAGLRFAVDFSQPFVGREALEVQMEAGVRQRLVLFSVPKGEPLLLHDEPIYRDGVLVGETTSGGMAFRVGGSLAFGWVRHDRHCSRDYVFAGRYEIEVGDECFEALALPRAPYDPDGLKMKR